LLNIRSNTGASEGAERYTLRRTEAAEVVFLNSLKFARTCVLSSTQTAKRGAVVEPRAVATGGNRAQIGEAWKRLTCAHRNPWQPTATSRAVMVSRGSKARVLHHRTRQDAGKVFADETTDHPALIPHEPPGDPRRHPQIPATGRAERPALDGNPRLSPLSPEAP